MIKYYTNTMVEKASERKMDLTSSGKIVTSLSKKVYYFNNYSELTDCQKKFDIQKKLIKLI